ncbi:MAG TPA: FG-GAP-like repeat-containing protein [Tepidisphaeraceae bacterium]|nr:FG-GAP-like repeat-containing protein [Tepidisphaeraceae bacterium]
MTHEALEGRRMMSFAPAVNYPTGPQPKEIVTADFNHDGRLDLVALNESGSVSVLLGNGDGGFGAPRTFAAGNSVQSLTVGDFDNDGNPDVATANVHIGVTALLGNGDGTFRPAVSTVMTYARPLVVAAADLNGDGKSDLVAGGVYYDEWETRSSVVSVLYGNGAGGFNDVGWYNVGDGTPEDIMVADLNRDGRADVVTTTYDFYPSGGHIVTVLLGSATGALNLEFPMQFDTGESPRALAVGDFTGDGVPDVVTAGQTVEVLRGYGNGTFAPPVSNSASSPYLYAVAAADFNGDGKSDVVVEETMTGAVEVLLGRGDGTLSLASEHVVGATVVAAGDFNADGRADVATANYGSNDVSILLNDGAWAPISPSLRIGDVQVTEGNSGTSYATFTVTLSNAYNEPVTVNFATLDGSATAGSDYQARSGTLTFAAGETTKTVSVAIFGDTVIENDEGFYLVLSGPSANSNLSDGWGAGSIHNDDPAFPPGKGRKKK